MEGFRPDKFPHSSVQLGALYEWPLQHRSRRWRHGCSVHHNDHWRPRPCDKDHMQGAPVWPVVRQWLPLRQTCCQEVRTAIHRAVRTAPGTSSTLSHKTAWINALRASHKLVEQKRRVFWRSKMSSTTNPRQLWRAVDSVFGRTKISDITSSAPTSDDFATYFTKKVDDVRRSTQNAPPPYAVFSAPDDSCADFPLFSHWHWRRPEADKWVVQQAILSGPAAHLAAEQCFFSFRFIFVLVLVIVLHPHFRFSFYFSFRCVLVLVLVIVLSAISL